MIFSSWFGFSLFIGALIALALIVPLPRIKELLPLGLVGGAGLAFLLIYFMQNVWGYWSFKDVDLLNVIDIPFFLSLSWFPIVILYSHLIGQYRSIILMLLIVVGFPIAATITQLYLIENQLLTYQNWNYPLTFLLSLAIHLIIAFYLYTTGKIRKVLH